MSLPILPLQQWPARIPQASVPANDNALRLEALSRSCLGVANDESGTDADGDVWLVGSAPSGAFSAFDENDIALARLEPDDSVSWSAWAPVDGVRVTMLDGSRKVYIGESTDAWVADTGGSIAAEDVSYDNASSGLSATDAQGAIDELEGMIGSSAVTSVNGDTGAVTVLSSLAIAFSDETTGLTTGAAKATFHLPFDFTLSADKVIVGLTTPQTSGSIFTVDVNVAGSSILSTKATIDNTEETTLTATTPLVCTATTLTKGQKVTVDVDQVGDGTAKGGKVYLIGYPT